MNSSPMISVVMPTYNGEKFIHEAIDSIINQTYSDFEFIIVDDGSTDDTPNIIKRYTDNRIVYVKKEKNSGISDSLNLGISKAKGKYIARMDDDDVSFPERFEKQLEILEQNKDIIFCGSTVTDIDSKVLPTPEQHKDILMQLLFSNPIFHPTAIIRRDVLAKYKYDLDAVPSEDYNLWSRLIFEGKFHQLQQPLLYCRIHQTSTTARRRNEQLNRNILITKNLYNKLGLISENEHDINLKVFTAYDYSVTGRRLRKIIDWVEDLKQKNRTQGFFPSEEFDKSIHERLKKYILSYFINVSKTRKLKALSLINGRFRRIVLKHYFKSLILRK